MLKRNLPAPLLVLLLLTSMCIAEDPQSGHDLAPPKQGVTVAPPLSADPPPEYQNLPLWGTIDWTTRRLPWVDEGPYAGISGAAMTTDGKSLYVAGGFIPGGDETDDQASRRTSRWAWTFNANNDRWTQLANMPFRREYTRGVIADSRFFVFGGGMIAKGHTPPYAPHGECAVLDIAGESADWQIHSSLNVPRTHTSVGRVGNLLIVAGGNQYDFAEKGYSHRTIRDTTEVFDLDHPERGWQVRAPIPTGGRGWSASVTADGRLFVFGGLTWNEEGQAVGLHETWKYDPHSDAWQQLTPSPLTMSGWEAGLYADRYALIVGGVSRPGPDDAGKLIWSDLVWAYDCRDDKWFRATGKLPPGAVFNDPGVAVIGNTLYTLGAEGPRGSHYNYFLTGQIEPTSR